MLEIGTGTGYNAALLGHLVGETGAVVSVDIDADLVADARERLAACGVSQVTVCCGDGGVGWPERAPYDRIIATVGAWDISPAWVDQLAPGGRLVVPLDLRGAQRSIAFQPIGDHLESISVVFCGFIRIRGAFAGPESIHQLGPEPGVFLGMAEQRPWTSTLFMRRWPGQVWTCPAASASRPAKCGTGSAYGWRCTNPP